jgi:hypothetical protein
VDFGCNAQMAYGVGVPHDGVLEHWCDDLLWKERNEVYECFLNFHEEGKRLISSYSFPIIKKL